MESINFKGVIRWNGKENQWTAEAENGEILYGDFLESIDNIFESNDIGVLNLGDEIEFTINIERR
jgi:hypothetical protein